MGEMKDLLTKFLSYFETFSWNILVFLVLLMGYLALLQFVGDLPDEVKPIIVVGMPLLFLGAVIVRLRKGRTTVGRLCFFVMGFVLLLFLERAIRFLAKLFLSTQYILGLPRVHGSRYVRVRVAEDVSNKLSF